MDFIKKAALFIFCSFILILFVWALYLPKENLEEKVLKTLESQKERADVSFKEVVFSESLGSKKFWKLTAVSAVLNKDTGLAELKEVKGLFFDKNRPSLYFISPFAKWDMKKKEIYLDFPVGYDVKKFGFLQKNHPNFIKESIKEQAKLIQQNQKTGPGYWFRSNYLNWKISTQKVSCKDGIVLKGRDFTIRSKNLEGNLTFNELILSGDPHASIGPASVEARVFKFYPAKEEVFCEEEVKVYYDDILATAEKARLLAEKEIIILSKNAAVQENGNKLSGEEIRLWLKDKRVKLKGKTKILLSD